MLTEALRLLNTLVLVARLRRMCHNYLESMRVCIYAPIQMQRTKADCLYSASRVIFASQYPER